MFGIANFCSLQFSFALNTWLPQLMRGAGYPLGSTLQLLLLLNIGALCGVVFFAWLAERIGVRVVAPLMFVVAALALGILGLHISGSTIRVLVFLIGAAGLGSQSLLFSFMAMVYRQQSRATAVGAISSIGHLGAATGTGRGRTHGFGAFGIGPELAHSCRDRRRLGHGIVVGASRRCGLDLGFVPASRLEPGIASRNLIVECRPRRTARSSSYVRQYEHFLAKPNCLHGEEHERNTHDSRDQAGDPLRTNWITWTVFRNGCPCDVVIVGYGPVGMMQAALLAQRGLKVIVVERFPKRYMLGRAGHFDGETFRTFQQLGIAEDMELLVRPMLQWELVTGQMELLATIKLGESGAGWKDSYLSYQPEFEVVFDAKVRELGVRVFMGLDANAIEQKDDRAFLTVSGSEDNIGVPVPDKFKGQSCVMDASFILGADGARSFVRDALQIGRRDLGFKANAQLVIDFEHSDPDRDLASLPEVFQILDIARPRLAGTLEWRTLFPMGVPPSRRRNTRGVFHGRNLLEVSGGLGCVPW